MFSPATLLCIALLLACVWIQTSGLRLPRLALIYLGGIEGASLVGALVCSAISINRVWLSEPILPRAEPMELSQGLSRNPAAGDAHPMPAPEPMPEEQEEDDGSSKDRVVSLDSFRRR